MRLLDHALGDDRGVRTRNLVFCASALGVLLAFLAEEGAPKDLTMGTLPVLPVLTAALLTGGGATAVILVLAVGLRLVDAISGDIPMDLAAVDVGVYVLVAGVASKCAAALRRGAVARPAAGAASASVMATVPATTKAPVPPSITITAHHALTHRERQVIEMAARGLTARQIGERLFIGRRTVETHLARAYEKVGVRSKKHLVAVAFDAAPELAALGDGRAS
jgi:DNA-binding CsgD family transcriptional regulator